MLDHVTPAVGCYADEIFRPVLSIVRDSGYDKAVAIVSGNPHGNGAAIFTSDEERPRWFTHEVEAGMVGIMPARIEELLALRFYNLVEIHEGRLMLRDCIGLPAHLPFSVGVAGSGARARPPA